MRQVIEHQFTGLVSPVTAYNPARTNLGSLIQQYSGATPEERYAGPMRTGLARPMEAPTAIAGTFPHVIRFSSTVDWVFLADNGTAGATRRIVFYEFDRTTSLFTWRGFITLTYPPTSNHTIRGMRMVRELYTVGAASVSGTAVTGTGTAWQASRLAVGSRIGFGSTDPTQITTWYQIASIGGDGSITLTASAGTIANGAYVIEDLRCATTTTNATATNGGLFLAKGLRIEDFTAAGTVIPAATTVDNIKAVYWLADAATVTNTTAAGLALGARTDWTDQRAYVLNSGTSVYVYNLRATLTLTAGRDNTTRLILTGNQVLTGTLGVNNNGRVGILQHGPGAGVESLYFVTTTRVYRAPIASITNGSTTWAVDQMLEVPPGSVNTFAATGALNTVEIAGTIDRLVVCSTGANGVRSYVTRFNTNSDPFDHIFLIDSKQQDQSTADAGAPPHPTINASGLMIWAEGGVLYLVRPGTSAPTNHMYAIPIEAHWTYAEGLNQVLITPAFNTSDATRFYRLYVNEARAIGTDLFMVSPEPYRVQYRTAGITDNTGTWTTITDVSDLSSITPAAQIQFRMVFRILGNFCLGARLYGIALTYEDQQTDSRYRPVVARSSVNPARFAYRQTLAFGSNIPNLRMRIYNLDGGALLLDDTVTASAFGVWEYSTDGGATWLPWSAAADLVGNVIRYSPTALPGGVRVRPLLTVA